MAKKKSTSAKNKLTKPKGKVSRKTADEKHLELLIEYSKRAITGQGSGVDEFFQNQTKKLEKQLEELRIKNELRKDIR